MNGAVPSEPYLQGPAASMLAAYAPGMELDKLPGDPKKLATKLVETVDGAGVGAGKENPHWIPFGKDANWCMRRKALRLLRDADTLEELSNSVDMDGFDEKDRAWPNLVKDILL